MSTNTSFISIREAATRLSVHESTVRRYADRGLIGAARLPSGVRRLRRNDVDALARRMPAAADDDMYPTARAQPAPADTDGLSVPFLWESDEDLEDFLRLTYAERDHDR